MRNINYLADISAYRHITKHLSHTRKLILACYICISISIYIYIYIFFLYITQSPMNFSFEITS